MTETAYAWAPITKMERDDDGTLLVYGPAASNDLDRDKQRLNPRWLDQAMPAWFNQGANVREQHDGKKAVGVGIGLTKGAGEAHMLAARIVDPVAVMKCEHGVLRGFSVGIKNPKVAFGKADAPGGEVVGGEIVEVSVVDRPCNPTTLFEIAKADGAGDLSAVDGAEVVEKSEAEALGLPAELYEWLPTPTREALASLAEMGAAVTVGASKADDVDSPTEATAGAGGWVADGLAAGITPVVVNVTLKADLSAAGRKEAAASDVAMENGSYPIKTKADLRKAIRAVGRGGADHDAIRVHIISRAKALGLEAMVPENWNSDGSLKKADDGVDQEAVDKAEQVMRDMRVLAPGLIKADGSDGDETGDIDGATAAIAAIAKLIISEAESLAQGNFNELCDIALLCSAAESLKWFACREQAEQADGADMGLADAAKADAPETSAAESAADTQNNDENDKDSGGKPAVTKSDEPTLTKADVADLIKAAVAEANDAAEERMKTLAADLAKAQQAIDEFRSKPVPGGPVLTRTQAQEGDARKSDADQLRARAAQYMAKADAVDDRDLREGYREKARDLLAKADA